MFAQLPAAAQKAMPLYEKDIPNARPWPDEEGSEINGDGVLIISKVSRPTLTAYLPPPEKATGTAVVICPGGGYWVLAAGHEGADVAKKFTEMGIAAFVLKYRIPNKATMINPEIGPLQDAQRALQVVRLRAKEWGINPARVGIMGFSAGGHLAATAGTHFQKAYIPNKQNISLRPDFMILVYPVISFKDSIMHEGSREQIIGKTPTPQKIKEYSAEERVTANTPPTFLVHAKDDFVKVANSISFAAALQQAGVPHQLLLYEKGGHGYGMYNKQSKILWMEVAAEWLQKTGFIPSAAQ